MRHPDQQYIEALLTNDVPLLNDLYRQCFGKVKRMVLQNNGSGTDAADLFQDALLSIYHKAKIKGFTLTCPLEAFLYTICKNNWMSEMKKKKTRGVTISDPEGYSSMGDDDRRLAEECQLLQSRQSLLAEKLADLGESCQRLLHLSWSGKPMEEVAAALRVTYGYARKKKSECMARLIMLVRESPQFNSLKW